MAFCTFGFCNKTVNTFFVENSMENLLLKKSALSSSRKKRDFENIERAILYGPPVI